MEYDIESILEKYEDDYNPGPRPMAQEPRIPFGDGLSVDPERDSFKKISNVIGAYNRYRRGEKNPVLNFNQFFELFSTENFATGGSAGQLVQPNADGSRPGYAGVKGQDRGAVQNLYDQFGKKVIDKLSREKFGKNFDKVEGGRGANARNNFVARIKEKGPLSLKELQLAGRDLQVKNRLGIQLDILEDLKKGPVTVEALAKKYKVSQKVIKEKGTRLLKNIYNKNIQMGKGVERGGRWLPDDDVTIDKILNNISKSPKLAVIQKDQIGRLFYDAFGREKLSNGKKNPTYNSKKYTAILKNLNEYNNIKKIISDKYPNIKLELDHPLSKSTLRKFFNASVDELVAVNPLERSLNQGFKKSLSDSYEKAITGEGNLKQKKAIEKIAKDLNINIGNVSNNLSKYKTGTKSFEKLNIKDEILKSMQTQADLNSNLKNYVKQNTELFKTANVNPNTNITKVTQGQVKQVASLLEKLGCGRAAGGRILFSKGTPDASLTKCGKKGIARFMDDLKKGNYSKASLNILKGGGNILKNIVDPMELLKLRNLIGPGAMGLMAAFEAGVITDDVIRQGTPLNESLANNWLTKTFLPYTKEYAQAKNLLESGTVPSNMKKYVQDVITFNDALMDIKGIENRKDSRLVDDSFGMIDGTSMYTKEQEQKDDTALMKKLGTLTEDVYTPGSAKALEMRSLQDENEATRMAKKEFSPIFGFDKLKDRNLTSVFDSYISATEDAPKDFRPITYEDAEYEDKKLPLGLEQLYMNKLNLKPRDSLKNYFFKDGPKKKIVYGERKQDFAEKPISILEDLTNDYNKFERQKEASKYPGYYGANKKFMEGGIASLNVKK